MRACELVEMRESHGQWVRLESPATRDGNKKRHRVYERVERATLGYRSLKIFLSDTTFGEKCHRHCTKMKLHFFVFFTYQWCIFWKAMCLAVKTKVYFGLNFKITCIVACRPLVCLTASSYGVGLCSLGCSDWGTSMAEEYSWADRAREAEQSI